MTQPEAKAVLVADAQSATSEFIRIRRDHLLIALGESATTETMEGSN